MSPRTATVTGLATRRCAVPHGEPRRAATRSRLCVACRDRLDQQLRGLPDLYTALERTRVPGVPLSPRMVELRVAFRGVLASWSQLVAGGRGVARPVRSVAGMAEFLSRHADWLGAHPAAAEVAAEIGELVAEVTAPVALLRDSA